MSLDILKKRIKENNLSGVFLFCGPEEYTKDHYANLIRNKTEASPIPEFNHIYFNAGSENISDFEDAVYSLPYMWDSKLIEITDIDSARFNESDVKEYARIFSEIPEYLTVLIVHRANDTDDDSKKASKQGLNNFYKAVQENGLVVEFETEKSDKLATWISKHLNAKGVTFDVTVPREIINVCGSDMYILQGEINKLVEVYSGNPLKVSDVRKYCCANSAYKYFDISDALNRRDMVAAKRILDSLELDRDTLPKAIGYLSKNYADMLLVKTGIDSGKSFETIAKDLKLQSWRVSKISQSVGKTDIKTLAFAINQLADADMKLKSFRGDPQRILELAFYRICTYGRKA